MNFFLKKLNNFKNSEMFFPTWISIFINPFYFARKNLNDAIKKNSSILSGSLVDIGCGVKPYESLFLNVKNYIGLEYDNIRSRELGKADFFYKGNLFPFNDNNFDSALCNQVLEHVFTPKEFLKEINRVLKPEGILLLTIPFIWDEHEQPHDFARYSSFGASYLLEEAGFEIIKHEKLCTNFSVISQIINGYIFKVSQKLPRLLRAFITILIIAPVNIFGVILSKIIPANEDIFLDQLLICKKYK